MEPNLIAKTSIGINASPDAVWQALVSPAAIKQYMFDTTAVSDWHEGSPIVWKGEWQGTAYEDKGVILQLQPGRLLQYSHFSPLSGLPGCARALSHRYDRADSRGRSDVGHADPG